MNNQAPLTAQALIEVKDLSFKRGERVIYDQVNLKIRQGQITGIMGPSGTGKTTLLRLIGGQLTPDQGEVLFLEPFHGGFRDRQFLIGVFFFVFRQASRIDISM